MLESTKSGAIFEYCVTSNQGYGVGVVRSRRFLGGVAVGFLLNLGAGVGFLSESGCPIGSLLYHTSKLGIPVAMLQFLLKLLLKQRSLAAVHQDFH